MLIACSHGTRPLCLRRRPRRPRQRLGGGTGGGGIGFETCPGEPTSPLQEAAREAQAGAGGRAAPKTKTAMLHRPECNGQSVCCILTKSRVKRVVPCIPLVAPSLPRTHEFEERNHPGVDPQPGAWRWCQYSRSSQWRNEKALQRAPLVTTNQTNRRNGECNPLSSHSSGAPHSRGAPVFH